MNHPTNPPVDWETLVTQEENRLYRTALAILGDPSEAQDAVQEAFLAFLEKAPQNLEIPGAWLMRVLVNGCKSRLRLRWRRPTVPLWEDMREDGKSIVIITHKLNEVLSLSDRVTVLHKGKNAGTVNTAETNEAQLTEMMVGQKVVLNIERKMPENPEDRLVVKDVSCLSRDGVQLLDRVTFTARAGEILGIAGIAGSGQRELLEAIAGLQPVTGGEILYEDPKSGETENLRDKTPLQIRELGVRLSFVPEDRLGMGLVSNMDIIDNMMLRSYRRGRSAFLDRQPPRELAERIIEDLGVVTPNATTPVRRLSGGNVQKVLVGREIASAPTVLMAAYPVRGLDINSSYLIYHLLNQQKEKGVAVIYVGEDLDVLLALCDRVIVLSGGRVTGTVDGRTATKEEIGLLMTKAEREGESHVKAE